MPIFIAGLFILIFSNIQGCALNENTYLAATDPNANWKRSGYSIKPPLREPIRAASQLYTKFEKYRNVVT